MTENALEKPGDGSGRARRAGLFMENAAWWVVLALTGGILLFTTVTTTLYRFYTETGWERQADCPLLVLLWAVGAAGVILALGMGIRLLQKKLRWIGWALVALLAAAWCTLAVQFLRGAKILPTLDALCCYNLALSFLRSDFSSIVPKGSWLSFWPYETGYIFMLEKTMRLFHFSDELSCQYVNVAFCALGFLSGYGILREFTDSPFAASGYLVFAFTDFAYLIRCSEIYGDIPEYELLLFAAWMFLRYFRGRRLSALWGVLGMGATVAACTYKQLAQIFVIALLIVGVWRLIRRFDWKLLVLLVLTAALGFNATAITKRYYEAYAHNTLGKGDPLIGYLAMGLQDNGAWNGFHYDTFLAVDYDYDAASEIFRESIRESWRQFFRDPAMAGTFFYNKAVYQWAFDSYDVYSGIDALYNEPRSEFALSVEYGAYQNFVLNFGNYRLSAVYLAELLGAGFLIFRAFRARRSGREGMLPPELLLGYICLIGGFLFSLIWEAHALYAAAYVHLALPFSLAFLFGAKGGSKERQTKQSGPKSQETETGREKAGGVQALRDRGDDVAGTV